MPFLKKVFCDVGCVVKPKCLLNIGYVKPRCFLNVKYVIAQMFTSQITPYLIHSPREVLFIYCYSITPFTAFQLNFPIFPFYKMSKRQARDVKLQTNLQIVKPADNFAYTKHPRLGFIQLPHQ